MLLQLCQNNIMMLPPPKNYPPGPSIHMVSSQSTKPLAWFTEKVAQSNKSNSLSVRSKGNNRKAKGRSVSCNNPYSPPLLAQVEVCVICSLSLETRGVDYHQIFSPSYFQPIPNFAENVYNFSSMNILSWNVRGTRGTNFRRDKNNSHNPDLVILTEMRLSEERASSVISNLGYEVFFKVDTMGFSDGIWILWNPTNVVDEPVFCVLPWGVPHCSG